MSADPILARIVFDTNDVNAPNVRSTDGKVTVARTGVGVFTLTRDTDAGGRGSSTTRDYVEIADAGGANRATTTSIAADVVTLTVRALGTGAAIETTGHKIAAIVRRAQRLAT